MLGSMSHLAPKQLASALPKVVPQLIEACSDTNPKVKASAEEALNEISKVIKNPEVSSISSILLKALTDPAETIRALEALIETEFVHAIDAPSLAIIVPVLHRGLRDRGATTKRYGALIAGNICTMIHDPRDFEPYVPVLIPDLKSALLDPIPDVRSTSAKALGSLTRGLGEEALADLRPWLIAMLRDESRSSAERSGAAQGLT
jgi:HEAT repeat protein